MCIDAAPVDSRLIRHRNLLAEKIEKLHKQFGVLRITTIPWPGQIDRNDFLYGSGASTP